MYTHTHTRTHALCSDLELWGEPFCVPRGQLSLHHLSQWVGGLRGPQGAQFLPSRATVLHLRLPIDQRCSTAPWAGRHGGAYSYPHCGWRLSMGCAMARLCVCLPGWVQAKWSPPLQRHVPHAQPQHDGRTDPGLVAQPGPSSAGTYRVGTDLGVGRSASRSIFPTQNAGAELGKRVRVMGVHPGLRVASQRGQDVPGWCGAMSITEHIPPCPLPLSPPRE